MRKVISVAPVRLPVEIYEVKEHLNITSNDDDKKLQSLINAAVRYIETEYSHYLIEQTHNAYFDGFTSILTIEAAPITSIESIEYTDQVGNSQTLDPSAYDIDLISRIARVCAIASWPMTDKSMNAVRVTYKTGYGVDSTFVPEQIKQAIYMLVGHWYLNRESTSEKKITEIDFAVSTLLKPYALEIYR